MSFIIFFLFAVIIFIIALVLTLVKGVSSFLFGRSKPTAYREEEQYDSSVSSKKIFSKEDGEYVSYEEISE